MDVRKNVRWIGVSPSVLIALVLGGCAVNTQSIPYYEQQNILTVIGNGSVELNCTLACAGQYGWNRIELRRNYDTGNWRNLALMIVRLNHRDDQSYFYLGRAAEGLGAFEAALVYYNKSLAITQNQAAGTPCGGSLDVCDGFSFPRDALYRINVVNQILAERRAVPASVPGKTPPPTKPAPAKAKKTKVPKQKPSDDDIVGY